jgi:hypothetical protein
VESSGTCGSCSDDETRLRPRAVGGDEGFFTDCRSRFDDRKKALDTCRFSEKRNKHFRIHLPQPTRYLVRAHQSFPHARPCRDDPSRLQTSRTGFGDAWFRGACTPHPFGGKYRTTRQTHPPLLVGDRRPHGSTWDTYVLRFTIACDLTRSWRYDTD